MERVESTQSSQLLSANRTDPLRDKRSMRARWWIAGVAAAIVAALVIVLLSRETGPPQAGQPNPALPSRSSSSVSSPPPLTEESAKALAADLTSGDEFRVRRALAISETQPLAVDAVAQLASITPLDIDIATFHDERDGYATATARTSRPSPTSWTLHFVAHEDTWKISNAEAKP